MTKNGRATVAVLALAAAAAAAGGEAGAYLFEHEADLPATGTVQVCDVSGDTVVVGAPRSNGYQVFVRVDGAWVEQGVPMVPGYVGPDRRVGSSVSIDGDLIAIGDQAGAVSVFERTGGIWAYAGGTGGGVLESWQYVAVTDLRGATMIVTQPSDRAGSSEVVGSGAIYHRDPPLGWGLDGAITPETSPSFGSFGSSPCLAEGLAAVAQPGIAATATEASGVVWVFEQQGDGSWLRRDGVRASLADVTALGPAVALSDAGDLLFVGAELRDPEVHGRVLVFSEEGGAWVRQAVLELEDGATGSRVSTIAVDGPVVVTGGAPLTAFVRRGTTFDFDRATLSGEDAIDIGLSGRTVCAAGAVYTLEDGRESGPCELPGDCASGFCVDGVCCDGACGGGAEDCQACSVAAGGSADGACTPLASAGVVCRPSTAACDPEETCSESSTECPADENDCAEPDGGPADGDGDADTAPPDDGGPSADADTAPPDDGGADGGEADAGEGGGGGEGGCACRAASTARRPARALLGLSRLLGGGAR